MCITCQRPGNLSARFTNPKYREFDATLAQFQNLRYPDCSPVVRVSQRGHVDEAGISCSGVLNHSGDPPKAALFLKRRRNIDELCVAATQLTTTERWSVSLAVAVLALTFTVFAQTDEMQVYDAEIAPRGMFHLMVHTNRG